MEEAENLYSALEKACKDGNLINVEHYIDQLKTLTKKHPKLNNLYLKAIVIATETFQGKFSSIKLKEFMKSARKLVTENPLDQNLQDNYAIILRASLSAMSTKGQPILMQDIIKNLDELTAKNPTNVVISEQLSYASREIAYYWKNRGDFKAVKDRTRKFRELAKKFPDNEKIKLNLSKALTLEIDSSNKYDIKNIDQILTEIQQISESTPANVGLQLEWIHAYRTALDRSYEKPEDTTKWLDSMKKIVANQKEDLFKVELAKGYLNAIATTGKENPEETLTRLNELKVIADKTKNNIELQLLFAQSLLESLKVIGIADKIKTDEILNELKRLNNDFPAEAAIKEVYVESLIGVIGLYSQAKKGEEINKLLDQFQKLVEKYKDDPLMSQIGEELKKSLTFLGYKKEKTKKVKQDYT